MTANSKLQTAVHQSTFCFWNHETYYLT